MCWKAAWFHYPSNSYSQNLVTQAAGGCKEPCMHSLLHLLLYQLPSCLWLHFRQLVRAEDDEMLADERQLLQTTEQPGAFQHMQRIGANNLQQRLKHLTCSAMMQPARSHTR